VRPAQGGKLRNAELILKSTLFNAPSAHEFHGPDFGEVFFLTRGRIAAEPKCLKRVGW